MTAHKGRCFRQLRRTAQRKERQRARGYVHVTPRYSSGSADDTFAARLMQNIFTSATMMHAVQQQAKMLKVAQRQARRGARGQ